MLAMMGWDWVGDCIIKDSYNASCACDVSTCQKCTVALLTRQNALIVRIH